MSIIVALVAAPVPLAVILFAALAHGVPLPVRLLVVLFVVAVLAGVAIIVYAHVRSIGYAVCEHDVGIFFRTDSVQPLKRIQHISSTSSRCRAARQALRALDA